MFSWRGGAFVVAMTVATASATGCSSRSFPGNGAGPAPDLDLAVYQECASVCVRPSDCAVAYNDDGFCPPGFLCSLRFSCSSAD